MEPCFESIANKDELLELWIDNSSSFFERSKTTRPNSSASTLSTGLSLLSDVSNRPSTSSTGNSLSRKWNQSLNTKDENEVREQQYVDLTEVERATCKHDGTRLTTAEECKQITFLPRSFQHHIMQRWMKMHYLQQGYDLKKNYRCPPSICDDDVREDAVSSLNWVSYKYIRENTNDNTGKEVMCRYCHGTNWVSGAKYFKHLFLAHGIMTEFAADYSMSNCEPQEEFIKVEAVEITDYYTVLVQQVEVREFSRNILPYLTASLIPLPEKIYSNSISGGFKRIHVLCPNCSKWIRLGWCEHDEILREQNDDEYYQYGTMDVANTIRNLTVNYSLFDKSSYYQKRDRNAIEGLYENYFSHYLDCDFERFQSKCLYVEVLVNN